MRSFRSSQNHCCCCVIAVLLSLGSVIITGIGVCVLLRYVMISKDILPPQLQKIDGQKVVGIIITCVGVAGIIISAMVALLYFTVCHETRQGQPAITQKIHKLDDKTDPKSPATLKSQANGLTPSHLQPNPKTPHTPKLKPQYYSSERQDSASGGPLTSTPRRMRGKNSRPLSSNLDIVKEVEHDGGDPLPLLQINGIDVGVGGGGAAGDNCKEDVDVFLTGNKDILMKPLQQKSTISSSDNTTTTTTNNNNDNIFTVTNNNNNTTILSDNSNCCESTEQLFQSHDTESEIISSRL